MAISVPARRPLASPRFAHQLVETGDGLLRLRSWPQAGASWRMGARARAERIDAATRAPTDMSPATIMRAPR